MSHDNLILEAIKKTLHEGQATVNLREASALTGSGSGIGGNIVFDDAFAALRLGNPIRQLSRVVPCNGSDMMFVAKTGNSTNATNPWGYPVNTDNGDPNTATSIWQIAVKSLNATLPIRIAAMDDINNLEPTIVDDLMMEFASLECQSMTNNSDQSGTTTLLTGGTDGLRGLDSYAYNTSAASYGTSGVGPTNGYHTILGEAIGAGLTYNQLVTLLSLLPPQYWHLKGTAWMMHPLTIQTIRELRDTQQLPVFLDIGLEGEEYLFGIRLIANSYMDYVDGATLNGSRFIYLANWPQFYTIGDQQEMKIKMLDQTLPGFINIWAEKRVVSSIRNPFAGVCLGT
jgi:HK97 family phage major capsid protein